MTSQSPIRANEERSIRFELSRIARPDSRFQYDLDSFIPDFPGSELAAERIRGQAGYSEARLIFATPDNALIAAREAMLRDGKTLLVPSYGLTQGFLLVDPASIPGEALPYAAWLDGVAHFGRQVSLKELATEPRVDFCVVGAAAVSHTGTRFGMGYFYFDIEWGILAGAGLVDPRAPVILPVHDCQLSAAPIMATEAHIAASAIVTPTLAIDTQAPTIARPTRLNPALLTPELRQTAIIAEYAALRKQG